MARSADPDVGLIRIREAGMRDRNHRDLVEDRVVRVRVGLGAGSLIGCLATGGQRIGDLRVARAEGRGATGAEVIVEEVGDIRIVGAPTEQEQTGSLPVLELAMNVDDSCSSSVAWMLIASSCAWKSAAVSAGSGM